MRIAYVVPMTWSCGGILSPFAQVNGLVARGHELTVFAPGNESIGWFPLRAELAAFPQGGRVECPFDIAVFVGDSFRRLDFSIEPSRFLLLQGKDYMWACPAERAALLRAYADPRFHLLAVSNWLAEFARDRCGSRRVSVIGNGIDLSRFRPETTARERFRLLIEGNFPDPNKNVLDALEIVNRVRQHHNVEIWALGRRFVSAGSLVDRVFENPAQEAIPVIYQQCDLLVKTSLMEGFGLPHLEAMACGCVPVTYASGGVLDFCRHGENSLIAGVGNVPVMVWHILRFLPDAGLRARLRENAMATARGRTWDRVAEQLQIVFDREARSRE